MEKRAKLTNLPKSMAERAVFARTEAIKDINAVQFDDEMLPWVYSEEDEVWYSFDGNYSRFSPHEKMQKILEREKLVEDWSEEAMERYRENLYWTKVRQDILERDEYTCQLCGLEKPQRSGYLHVHHILKKKEGGGDTYDNLILVCSKCHKAADGQLYDMDWDK